MGDVCNHLLSDPEAQAFIADRGPGGKACFVMPDEETSVLARQAGLTVMEPSPELRHRMDSKVVMTRLAEEAGVPSVPHVIGRAGSYDELLALARAANLGDDLVIQDPTEMPVAEPTSSAVSATGRVAPTTSSGNPRSKS